MRRSIISPQLPAHLRSFFPQQGQAQQRSVTADAMGGEIETWTASLSGIACHVAPAQGEEIRAEDGTYRIPTHEILLRGYYPTIETAQRFVVGVLSYDILSVSHDSQSVITRLRVREVTP